MDAMRAETGTTCHRARVAIVVSHPIQHFCPLYRALAKDGRLDLRVAFASRAGIETYYDPGFNREVRWQGDLVEGFNHEFLPGAEGVRDLSVSISNPALEAVLDRWEPDVVQVYGFHHGISRQAVTWARRSGRRVLYVADSELRTRRTLGARLRKRMTLPFLFDAVDGFLTVGDCNEAFYQSYGVGQNRLHRCPFTIDEERLDRAMRPGTARSDLRSSLGLEDGAILALVVGKLTMRKCPHHVIEAVSRLKARGSLAGSALAVVFAGDGPEMASLQAMARVRGLEQVLFPGFVEVGNLPKYYAGADVLVHPSSEDPHPLATSEAVACGLPIVVSDRVGSVGPTDDLRPGVNAIEYPFGDIAALAEALERVALDEPLRRRLGASSSALGRGRGTATSVEGYAKAVQWVLGEAPRRSAVGGVLLQLLR